MWTNPRERAAVDYGETDGGDLREEGDCGGKRLWRKAWQPWKQDDAAESQVGGGVISIASLSPHASTGS